MSVTFINPFIAGSSPAGQQVFTSSGTFNVPEDVTTISAVVVGEGEGRDDPSGRGGDLRYAISLAVTPLEALTVTVGATGTTIKRGGTTLLAARSGAGGITSSTIGGNIGGGNGASGGSEAGDGSNGGGGGAGGYSGNGGQGGNGIGSGGQAGGNGSGGGGGGGGGGSSGASGGDGGGVGILGAGSSGAGGAGGDPSGIPSGRAGSPGSGGSTSTYGGGAHSTGEGGGAARIIWGTGRAYPSTNTADV